MFNIDRRNNITLEAGDNAIIDVSLCGCDCLTAGDVLTFECGEQKVEVRDFIDGVAKVHLVDKFYPFEGTYCIYVEKADGRKAQIFSGKYIRQGGC